MKKEYLEDCPEILKTFLMELHVVKGRTERTQEAYYIDLRTFFRYLKIKNGLLPPDYTADQYQQIKISDTPLELITNFTLIDSYDYINYLSSNRKNNLTTRARKATALKQFYIFLTKKINVIDKNPIEDLELPKTKQALPKYLTLNQSVDLLSQVSGQFDIRDFCILTLFLNCGMRLSELVGLNLNDYSSENKTLRLFGKGEKERIVYLNDACINALHNYIEFRSGMKIVDTEALFLSTRGTRITKRRVQQIVENNIASSGLQNTGVTTHKLRHTAATLMYQHGNVDTLVLKEILGHKSISTTEIYTHISDENMKKAVDSSPLANINKKKNTK